MSKPPGRSGRQIDLDLVQTGGQVRVAGIGSRGRAVGSQVTVVASYVRDVFMTGTTGLSSKRRSVNEGLTPTLAATTGPVFAPTHRTDPRRAPSGPAGFARGWSRRAARSCRPAGRVVDGQQLQRYGFSRAPPRGSRPNGAAIPGVFLMDGISSRRRSGAHFRAS
jgi:hypothetical protein